MIYMGETSIFRKYYDAHQISKSVNILDVARLEYPNKNVIPIKCISSFLEPVEGWDRGVRNASTEIERMISFLFLIVNASLAAAEILFGSE